MIVVDANVVAYYIIEGEKTALARSLMQREPDWRMPPLWRHEYLNVVATYARYGGASVEQARGLWRRGIELFGASEHAADAEAALALAMESRISAYDAQYVALAQRFRAILVTEDRRLLRAFPDISRSMHAVMAQE